MFFSVAVQFVLQPADGQTNVHKTVNFAPHKTGMRPFSNAEVLMLPAPVGS